jgi:hypothetical protein
VKVLDIQVFERGGPSHVRSFLHDVHPQPTRSRNLNVAVTHPVTNAYNVSLTSSSDHKTILPIGHWYSSQNKDLEY